MGFTSEGFTSDQEKAFRLLTAGENVFLTGEAGTGKTWLISQFISYLKENDIKHIVCAPTGVAAVKAGGATLHRTFHIPTHYIDKSEYTKIKTIGAVKAAQVIIIDEISMCRSDVFDYVMESIDYQCSHKRDENGNTPFCQNKQIVVVGDFFQLPPVITKAEKKFFNGNKGFAFEGCTWEKCHFQLAYLHEIVRQKDAEMTNALNQARTGDTRCLSYFNAHVSALDNDAPTVCTMNREAENINEERLSEISGDEYTFTASYTGTATEKDFSGVDELTVKKGARVISLMNDPMGLYVNGQLGTVTDADDYDYDDEYVMVKWDNGITSKIVRKKWSQIKYEVKKKKKDIVDKTTGGVKTVEEKTIESKVIGEVSQIPLRLAYAITVHKSQGQTYERANIALSYVFADGQAYVALSRCTSPQGMRLKNPLTPSSLRASGEVIRFYREEEAKQKQREMTLMQKKEEAKAEEESDVLNVRRTVADEARRLAEKNGVSVSDILSMAISKLSTVQNGNKKAY